MPVMTAQKCARRRFFACTVQTKWAVEVFRTWQAAREPKFCILEPGSMFKKYDLYRVQSLEEKLEDLDSLSLNYWLTRFVSASFLVWNVFELHCKRKCKQQTIEVIKFC